MCPCHLQDPFRRFKGQGGYQRLNFIKKLDKAEVQVKSMRMLNGSTAVIAWQVSHPDVSSARVTAQGIVLDGVNSVEKETKRIKKMKEPSAWLMLWSRSLFLHGSSSPAEP